MSSVNRVIVLGRLGNDPDIRYGASGSAVAIISIATSEKWKDKQSGQMQERTEWIKATAFGRTAEVIGQYLTKGSMIYIEGRLQTDKYTDKNGIERYSTGVIIDKMQMIPTGQQQGNQQQNRPQNSGINQQNNDFDSFDDDVPF